MSVDSTALERSALERKDRDELMTIAQALGGKPGSRAKKATIIDLILELTGVAGGSDKADAKPADDKAEPETGTGEAAAKADADADSKADAKAAKADAEESDDAKADSKQSSGGGRRRRSGTRSDDADSGSTPAADEPPAEWELEADADDTSEGGQAGQAGGKDQGQNGGQGQNGASATDEEVDTGNRRRRRRGRNRDRGDQAAGQSPDEFTGEPVEVEGYLDLRDEGYGFLRINGFLPSRDDVYISVKQARQFGLRKGDYIKGASRPPLRNEKNPALLRIDSVNGGDPEKSPSRRRFEDLTPLFPSEKLVMELEKDPTNLTARIIDLIAPIGKGQRGLIVSPPKAGKTSIMKQIARSIETNNPECHLFVLLVDERPEEVTDMQRWLKNDKSSVIASTFDRPADEHIHVAELTIERAKRLVEDGEDVVVILDGITRLSRAYNLAAPQSGRVMTGGIDTTALYPPKRFFGAARNLEEGGSLTILATALVETGSRMDEVIFEEFKGTGNMELRLDRRLAEQRIYPAIDIEASSTRHEELLFQGLQLQHVWTLRRVLTAAASSSSGQTPLELLLDRMRAFKTNKELLAEVGKATAAVG